MRRRPDRVALAAAQPPSSLPQSTRSEWLETDGLGGFASGTVSGERTRRYHALLLAATTPPTGRFVLVNGFEAWIERDGQRFPLSQQRYLPDVVHPEGSRYLTAFHRAPWPTWIFRLDNGLEIEQQILVQHGWPRVTVSWSATRAEPGTTLTVRPLLSGRDHHGLHHENPGFRFDAAVSGDTVSWRPYPGVPRILARSNGGYAHDPVWYRGFLYLEERDRGLDHVEDLGSPGRFIWDLSLGEAVWLLEAQVDPAISAPGVGPVGRVVKGLRPAERRRRQAFDTPLERAADAYLVARGTGRTIIAGYPWFTDWGRDTFIALRGLCLATGRLRDAGAVLGEWAGQVSDGMLPNRFGDRNGPPEFNAVDASLWFVIAVHDYLEAALAMGRRVHRAERAALMHAVDQIVTGYTNGTRYGIHAGTDGLLAAGEPGVQLTWMDAKAGDWVVTPRVGKPVEIQALWLNALRIAGTESPGWIDLHNRGLSAFVTRFWNPDASCLHDVVDVDHVAGTADASLRPNQIFAVGGLPFPVVDGAPARQIVDAVESCLLIPLGLRTLSPDAAGYHPNYAGGILERDGAYHQGTAWPWLLGPFVEAWVRVRGDGRSVRQQARDRFLPPLIAHLEVAGLGHMSEIVAGDPPHTPGGCPFQAWSLAELLRLDRIVLADPSGPEPGNV